jgi:hypothetical protein
MAVLHRKEEKIEAVLNKLSDNYSDKEFVDMFIQLYSKDWGKIKANYIKQSQDKVEGTVVKMPKPEVYIIDMLKIFLSKKD